MQYLGLGDGTLFIDTQKECELIRCLTGYVLGDTWRFPRFGLR
jgi:hypothetical protein